MQPTIRRWTSASFEPISKKQEALRNSFDATERPSASSTFGKFSIRRRSGQFSDSSMALLRLQNTQQSIRLNPKKSTENLRQTESISRKLEFVSRKNENSAKSNNSEKLPSSDQSSSCLQIFPYKLKESLKDRPAKNCHQDFKPIAQQPHQMRPSLIKNKQSKTRNLSVRWSDTLQSFKTHDADEG